MVSIRLPGAKGPNESEWPPGIQKTPSRFQYNERKVNYEFEELHATVIKMWDVGGMDGGREGGSKGGKQVGRAKTICLSLSAQWFD